MIPDYTNVSRDAITNNETGLLIYISDTISYKQLSHLNQTGVAAVWLETSIAKLSPILVGFCHRNPASRVGWMDAFTEMMDRVSFEPKEIIRQCDFNIDLSKSKLPTEFFFYSFNLYQLVKSPTRVTQNMKTLIDHIYVSESRNVTETCLPICSISDHYPVCLTWTKKVLKYLKLATKQSNTAASLTLINNCV